MVCESPSVSCPRSAHTVSNSIRLTRYVSGAPFTVVWISGSVHLEASDFLDQQLICQWRVAHSAALFAAWERQFQTLCNCHELVTQGDVHHKMVPVIHSIPVTRQTACKGEQGDAMT